MRGLFHFRATPVGAPAPGANGTGSVYWFDSVRTEAVLLQSNASPPPCRSTRPGCEWGGLGVLVCLRFAPRRCSYNRTRHPHPVGAPAPGANKAGSVYWFDSVRTEAVLLQSNAPPHLVGASAPGANKAGSVYWFDSVRTEAVLLVSLPECWLATNTLVGRKPVALLRAMTLRRRSGSDLSLNLYGIRALPKRDEAA